MLICHICHGVFSRLLFSSSTGIKEKSHPNKKLVEMLCILKRKINYLKYSDPKNIYINFSVDMDIKSLHQVKEK